MARLIMIPNYPIYVIAEPDVYVFFSLDAVQKHVEHYDVDDGIYVGFDTDGFELDFISKNGEIFVHRCAHQKWHKMIDLITKCMLAHGLDTSGKDVLQLARERFTRS